MLVSSVSVSVINFVFVCITLVFVLKVKIKKNVKSEKKSNGPRSPESLWRRSEVRFLMGTQNYLLLPRSRQDEN